MAQQEYVQNAKKILKNLML